MMPVPLHALPGKRGSGTPRHPHCGIQAVRERFPAGFKASTAWVFICWACSLASEEVSLALLMNLTLCFPRLHWEESGVFPSSRAQKSTSICKNPACTEGEPRLCPPFSSSSRGRCHLPSPLGSSQTLLWHPRAGWAGRSSLPGMRERAGGPLNLSKKHSQLCVPVFPVDRVPNHHQKQRQHPEDLPSCTPRGEGERKTTISRGVWIVGCGVPQHPWLDPGWQSLLGEQGWLAPRPTGEQLQDKPGGFVPGLKVTTIFVSSCLLCIKA